MKKPKVTHISRGSQLALKELRLIEEVLKLPGIKVVAQDAIPDGGHFSENDWSWLDASVLTTEKVESLIAEAEEAEDV